ncbi:MAG: hypothetical protein Q9217_004675, partial [Psora testacea]
MASTVQIGQLIQGRSGNYRISQLLEDKSTQNKVWLAIGGSNNREYVVKTLSSSLMRKQRTAIEAFQKNRLIRQVVDEATTPPAFVLEHLDDDLLTLSSNRKLDISEVKAVGKKVLEAIYWMHETGYVHTDIKLNNVLINHENGATRITEVKLADCETAALMDENKSIAGELIGAPMFRSPEAFFRRGMGPATDIWSFGTMLISLLLGPNRHIFRPPRDTPDAEWDVAVLERHDLFFGPFPPDFAKRMGDDITQLLLTIAVPPHERQPFRNWDPNELAPADVDFV